MPHDHPLLGALCAVVISASILGQRNETAIKSRPNDGFKQYKAVEAYEVRPGILMLPQYSSDGQVCEIGLEKRHYLPTEINLGSEMKRKEIEEIANELVPPEQRGPKSDLAGGGLIVVSGQGMTTTWDYENVVIEIHSVVLNTSKKQTTVEDVAAVVSWKNRKCG